MVSDHAAKTLEDDAVASSDPSDKDPNATFIILSRA